MEWWTTLKDRHKGETGLIICNGGSLCYVPREFLSKYPTIGTNGIFKLPFDPTYYVAVNDLAIAEFMSGIKTLKSQKFIKNLYAADLDALPLTSDYKDCIFSKKPWEWIYEGGTVTYVALQIAYYLGFQTVLLVGLDHKYTYNGHPNEEVTVVGVDVNHFCNTYFPIGTKWNNPDLVQSEISYTEARRVFEEDGRRIINLTPNSGESVFEKGELKDYQNA